MFSKKDEDELRSLIAKIKYPNGRSTIEEMIRADELTRKKWAQEPKEEQPGKEPTETEQLIWRAIVAGKYSEGSLNEVYRKFIKSESL